MSGISAGTTAVAVCPKTYQDPSDTKAVAARLSIAERCQQCRKAKENLLAAIELLADVPLHADHEIRNQFSHPVDACLYVGRVYWQKFVEDTGVKSMMSIKKREELDRQLYPDRCRSYHDESAKLPPFEEAQVYAFFDSICGGAGEMIKEAIREVFEWLRPSHKHYKTNDEFQIGRKVILGYMAEHYTGVAYRRRAEVDALGNVLYMLDGKGVRKHPDTLSNAISNAWRTSDTYEDEYLIAKRFANQNAHITFKRPDLIAQINASSGELWLRQQTEQKSRGFSH
jgi:hypothetical protein